MKRISLPLLALLLHLHAASLLHSGASVQNLHLKDQFGKMVAIQKETRLLLVAFSKKGAKICNDYFHSKKDPAKFLQKHHLLYIADISSAPSFAQHFFILPQMKKEKFSVLVIDDKAFSQRFPHAKEEDILLVKVHNFLITQLIPLKNEKELAGALHE